MLSALKFCAGSVAKKDVVQCLTHFVIEGGRVRGYNGMMALCSPIPFDIKCQPKAETLIKAIAGCNDTVQLALTATGRLSVKSGSFKVFVDCINEPAPHPLPEGDRYDIDGQALLDGLKVVERFIGNDASRKWATGVLVDNQSLFATNNVTLVQYWTGINLPRAFVLPGAAVKEMLRINVPPVMVQIAETSVTFHYPEERWLRTQLFDHTQWPSFSSLLDQPSKQVAIPDSLFVALEAVKPFVDPMGRIIFQQQGITTHLEEGEGASHDVPELIGEEGKYCVTHLEALQGVAKTIDWGNYPKACIFMGDRLRGAIIGLRT